MSGGGGGLAGCDSGRGGHHSHQGPTSSSSPPSEEKEPPDADTLADWQATAKWTGKSLKDVIKMERAERSELVEKMWNLEDADVRVEAAFDELVERRKEVMVELVTSSQKELTKTLMRLLEFEQVILSTEDKLELKRIGQIGENKHAEKKLDTKLRGENKTTNTLEDEQQDQNYKQSLLDQGVLPEEERGLTTPNKETASTTEAVGRKRRNRRGGRGSRLRRLVDYHQFLSEKLNIPPSRLMTELAVKSLRIRGRGMKGWLG